MARVFPHLLVSNITTSSDEITWTFCTKKYFPSKQHQRGVTSDEIYLKVSLSFEESITYCGKSFKTYLNIIFKIGWG